VKVFSENSSVVPTIYHPY